MGTPVEKFIRDIHKKFNVKYALTDERVRRIRTKLKLAEIVDVVEDHDEKLAADIVLADYKMSSSNVRTASAAPSLGGFVKQAGVCPRCSQGMRPVRLAEANEANYCANCHVCIPIG